VWFGSSPSCEKELPRRSRVFTTQRCLLIAPNHHGEQNVLLDFKVVRQIAKRNGQRRPTNEKDEGKAAVEEAATGERAPEKAARTRGR